MTYKHNGITHKGEIRPTTRKGQELLQGISKELDFLILCKKGKNPCRLSDLRKHLGEEWFVGALNGDTKKYEILRDFGKYYWAHKGWDKRKKWDQYKEFHKDITRLLGKEILVHEEKEKTWRLLGDEIFLDDNTILRYIWVVIPPSSGLNPEFGFHATKSHPSRTKRMVERLIKRGIKIHVFEAPHEPNKADYTDRILPHTIPIMMDFIRTQIEDRTSTEVPLRIIAEGYADRTSKWGEKTLFPNRYDEKAVLPQGTGSGPNFLVSQSIPVRFVPKDGHPLIAYPDAVGAVIGRPKKIYSSTLKKLNPLVQEWTFEDAETLSGGLLSRTNLKNPADFFDELRKLPKEGNLTVANTPLESIVNYYSKNLVKDLRVEDFILFEKRFGPDSYQWASDRMIEDRGGIDSWINQIPEDAYQDRFDVNVSGVVHAARKTDFGNVMKYGKIVNDMIEKHEKYLEMHRIKKYQEIMVGIAQRFFVFNSPSQEKFDELQERALANFGSRNDRNLFGSWLLREAQRDGPDVDPKILQLQEKLRVVQKKHSKNFRDTVYLLEMQIDLSRGDSSYLDEALETHNKYPDEIETLWGIAAQLKLGVSLHEDGREIPGNIYSLLEKLDDLSFGPKDGGEDNPIVRCLAWGARLCDIRKQYESERRDRLVGLLRSRAESSLNGEREPLKDSVGLSHACHILDLEKSGEWGRGKKREKIGRHYLRLVLEKSYQNTKNWNNEKHQQNDPLAPLNLLHR